MYQRPKGSLFSATHQITYLLCCWEKMLLRTLMKQRQEHLKKRPQLSLGTRENSFKFMQNINCQIYGVWMEEKRHRKTTFAHQKEWTLNYKADKKGRVTAGFLARKQVTIQKLSAAQCTDSNSFRKVWWTYASQSWYSLYCEKNTHLKHVHITFPF